MPLYRFSTVVAGNSWWRAGSSKGLKLIGKIAPMAGLLLFAGAAGAQQYIISTIAGGAPPPTPAAALTSTIGEPVAVAVDTVGNLYFSSRLNCVFKTDRHGILTRVAGNCRTGYSGDGGPATNAQL